MPTLDNRLFYGDNLKMLRQYLDDESVDLIYLDPPFNSNQDYNAFFEEKDGSRSASQIKAFGDTWEWDTGAATAYREVVEEGGRVSAIMQAFWTFPGPSDMLAYLAMMAPRLKELRRVLKPTGSLYLHCDPTASHYLKLLLDAVFGPGNFRNEIIWHYKFRMMDSERIFNRKHDVILFYAKSPLAKIDMGAVAETWTREEIIRTRKQAIYKDDQGREWIWMPGGRGHSKNKPKFLDDIIKEGKALDDVWDMPVISSSAKERLGYPTQKPEALLERIIKASSKEGDVVLDPFCGCGTSIAVAQRLGRRWIGIDVTQLAVTLIKHRLLTAFGEAIKATFTVTGEPESVEDARVLARDDPYQFQLWALGLVNAKPLEGIKKGPDKGVDGRIYFHDEREGGKTNQIILSVKGGHLKPEYVRELPSIVDREKASIGVLISLEKPTAGMRAEAASADFYENQWWGKFPKIQLLTIEDLMGGRGIQYPHAGKSDRTFRRAPKVRQVPEPTRTLFDEDEPSE